MSVIFQSGQFEYQLPTAVGAEVGSVIELQENGALAFAPGGARVAYTGLCSIDFTGTVLANCVLTITTSGPQASIYLSAPTSGPTQVLQFDIDDSAPQWGSLVNANPAIPAELLPSGIAATGVVSLVRTAPDVALKQLFISLVGVVAPLGQGLISLNAVEPLAAGTYVLGGIAQVYAEGVPSSVYLGSYMLA